MVKGLNLSLLSLEIYFLLATLNLYLPFLICVAVSVNQEDLIPSMLPSKAGVKLPLLDLILTQQETKNFGSLKILLRLLALFPFIRSDLSLSNCLPL